MLPGFILASREGLEAALIVSIVFGVLRKMRREDLNPAVWMGVICAAIISFLIAVSLFGVWAEFAGQGEQLFEGFTMLLAAGILTWLITWLHN